MMDSMATGALNSKPLCNPECSGRPCRPVSSRGSNCYAVRFPLSSSDPAVSSLAGLHHCYDVAAVRRVANTNEQSDDFTALCKARKRRGDFNAFAKGRKAMAMAKVSRAPEPLPLNEMPYEDFCVDVLERFGEVGAEFSTHIMRLPWSLFQPQKFALPKGGRLRSGVRGVVDHLIQAAQPVAQSLDFRCSQKGLSKSGSNGGHGSMANAINTNADISASERHVHCEVEAVSWRERHISASVKIEATQERVWEVLTDYGRLAEFIPNLTRSEQIPCPHPGRKWLLQEGKQTAMYWQIEARVVLDLEELPDAKDGKELRFSMVDGDFKRYVGRWYLRPDARSGTTTLHYEVNVTPRLLFPAAFVEQIIKSDLPINLRAIANRAEESVNVLRGAGSAQLNEGSSAPVAVKEGAKLGERGYSWGAIGLTCKIGKPCIVDEVHLRRFDDLLENGVHRRVVAAITVEAPAHNVWAVLTDYERLHEFIPNLAICKVLTRENNRVRLLQEGCKCLLYMVLHARVVLDLWERPRYEIMFQQVEGDFDSFQGKWTLEPLGAQHTLLKYLVDTRMHKDSLLAEALVEEVIYEDLPANLCAIRDRVELLEFNSLQNGRIATNEPKKIDKQILREEDSSKEDETRSGRKDSPLIPKRPLIVGLQRDFNILEQELLKYISEKGTLGVMPLREELREAGRVDLEKAIGRNGGFGPVASKLNLSLAYKERKPRGYWDNLQNLHKEILLFQKEQGKERTQMPTRRSLEKAGRYDLARSLEKWGGLREVARVLGLQVKKQERSRTVKTASRRTPSAKVSDDNETDIQVPLKTARPLKSTKWVSISRGAAMDAIDQ